MAYNHEYPYFSADNANVDWFLDFVNRLHKEWEDMKKEWNNVLSEWDGMKNTWEEYRQELENRFGEFTTNITNQFGALRLEFTDLKQEFNALKTYVETQINNLPDEVKNIFQTYIDNGTILEMITPLLPDIPEDLKQQVEKNKNDIAGLTASLATLTTTVEGHTTQITNLTTQVNQNTADITANAGNIAKNTTDIGNNKLNIQNLTTTVGQHTTEISNIKTEQTEIMNDIADINTLDIEQNNRLTALENRPTAKGNYIWIVSTSHLSNIIKILTFRIKEDFLHVTQIDKTLSQLAADINQKVVNPGKTPTEIIILAHATSFNSNSINKDIYDLSTALYNNYYGIKASFVFPLCGSENPRNTLQSINTFLKTENRLGDNVYPYFSVFPWGSVLYYSDVNNQVDRYGDVSSNSNIIGVHYARLFYSSFFNGIYDTSFNFFEIPIILSGQWNANETASESWIRIEYKTTEIVYTIKMVVCGHDNNNADMGGAGKETLVGMTNDNVPGLKLLTNGMKLACAIHMFGRDNRTTATNQAGIITLRKPAGSNFYIYLNTTDIDNTSIINGFQVFTQTSRSI